MPTKKLHSTRLINRAAVRSKALAILAHRRPHLTAKFTRVSGKLYIAAQAALDAWLDRHVQDMPSKGKTIR
jgi:hypothetical protein